MEQNHHLGSLLLLLLLKLYAPSVHSQENLRFRDFVFDRVERQKSVYYGDPALRPVKRLLMDIYSPAGDTMARRPVIVLMHGGGFRFGSKNVSRMKIWGREFARRGYVCVAINYRLSEGNPLQHFNDLANACVSAASDADLAIQYLRLNHSRLRLDTGKIFLGGHSAGAMVALQSAFSSQEEVRCLLSKSRLSGEPAHNISRVSAIINFWGAVFDTSWLKNASIPIVSVHGERDRVVPFNDSNGPFYGSAFIHRVAQRENIHSELKSYPRIGHELQRHFNPLYAGPVARRRWKEAGFFAASFLWKEFYAK